MFDKLGRVLIAFNSYFINNSRLLNITAARNDVKYITLKLQYYLIGY
jgi:hypothetical protein